MARQQAIHQAHRIARWSNVVSTNIRPGKGKYGGLSLYNRLINSMHKGDTVHLRCADRRIQVSKTRDGHLLIK